MQPSLPERVDAILEGPRPVPLVTAGDPVLRTPARQYGGELGDERLGRLVAAMREALHVAPGVGLAAPQVGVPLRIAVIEDPAEVSAEVREERGRVRQPFQVLVNPSYESVGDATAAFFEGCLSVPGWQAVTVRHAVVRLRGQDERGRHLDEEFTGWPARIVQHETDHLNGILYLDKALTRSLSSNDHVRERWAHLTPAQAARELGFELP